MLYFIFLCCFFFMPLPAEAFDRFEVSGLKYEKLRNYLNNHPLAVISTIDNSRKESESALIAFTQNNELELYFMTFVDSRKFVNLQTNHSVSFVIGFDYTTLQYEGTAHSLIGVSIEDALQAFSEKQTPCSSEFLSDPRARFFKVVPKWIRYSDYAVFPAEIFEILF